MGLGSLEELEVALTQRGAADSLLDKLYARLSAGTVALTVQALIDYGDYAKARGAVDVWAVDKADMPRRRHTTAKEVYAPHEVETVVAAARGVSIRYWAFLLTLAE